MLYLVILLAFVFFASVAMSVGEGLWNNTIALISVMLCGISAILFGVPLGTFVAAQVKAGDATTWAFVFGVVWGVFAGSILRLSPVGGESLGRANEIHPPARHDRRAFTGAAVGNHVYQFYSVDLVANPDQGWTVGFARPRSWQRDAFQTTSAPFYTVVKRYAQADGAESSLVRQVRA